jgi:rhodanese-related sulfurtransferase
MSVKQINTLEAFELLKQNKNSVLVDVRTYEEFNFVGTANPTEFNGRMVLLPWQILPQMQENPQFDAILEQNLEKFFGKKAHDAEVIFICRTGARSNAAANFAKNLGYKNCYNLTSGFEGDLNEQKQRGQINGWKANNLPWGQK